MVIVGKENTPKNGDVTFMRNTDGLTRCEMYWDGKWFVGHAKCLEADMDMMSERTGCTIAEIKANIKRLKYIRKQKREAIKPLTLFATRLACCKDYNKDSFEARRLRKEIWLYEEEIQEITNAINDEETYLKKYIAEKDNLYYKLRRSKATN